MQERIKNITISWLKACFILLVFMGGWVSATTAIKFIAACLISFVTFQWHWGTGIFLLLSIFGAIIIDKGEY